MIKLNIKEYSRKRTKFIFSSFYKGNCEYTNPDKSYRSWVMLNGKLGNQQYTKVDLKYIFKVIECDKEASAKNA